MMTGRGISDKLPERAQNAIRLTNAFGHDGVGARLRIGDGVVKAGDGREAEGRREDARCNLFAVRTREALRDAEADFTREIFQQSGATETLRQFVEELGNRDISFRGGIENREDGEKRVAGGEGGEGAAVAHHVRAEEKSAVRFPAASCLSAL